MGAVPRPADAASAAAAPELDAETIGTGATMANFTCLAAARGDAGYGGDMVRFERMLHAEQKAEPQNSEHAPPALRRHIK